MPLANHTLDLKNAIISDYASFLDFLNAEKRFGRERELISWFTNGFLCSTHSVFQRNQVGIEVAVPVVASLNIKEQVCKDLVIWPEPFQTLWNTDFQKTNIPLAILEWKVVHPLRNQNKSYAPEVKKDIEWLQAFTSENPQTTGFSVFIRYNKGHL